MQKCKMTESAIGKQGATRDILDDKLTNARTVCALATPFLNGKIDVNSYVELCEYQQENGTDALLALGTTAEAQLLTRCERKLLVTLAKHSTTLPLIVGIEEPSTVTACEEAKLYADLGADALLVAPPSFCKCTPKGYVRHIEKIREAGGLPISLYNIPARAGYALDVSAVTTLAKSGQVCCIKDSSENMCFAHNVSSYVKVMCGSDERLYEYMRAGACGVISVVANVEPKLTKQAVEGSTEALKRFETLARLAMAEINPIAIKYMLYKAGIFADYEMRLPLTRASEETRKIIDEAWSGLK